jgi:hypothetical protein
VNYCIFEPDFSAIEAVLVGYFAQDKDYVRLAKLGVHDYFNSLVLKHHGKISASADISWSDADLRAFFADLKKRFKPEREVAKRTVHLSGYGGTPHRMHQMAPDEFPTVAVAREMQSFYFSHFPLIRKWQNATIALAARQGYLRTPFGNLHEFWKLYNWKKNKVSGEWEKVWGEDAKRALAFLPQSTAAGILKEVILALPDEILNAFRIPIHDSLAFFAMPKDKLDEWGSRVVGLMERPIPCLPLPPEWGMGDHLSIGVEAKAGGPTWADVEKYTLQLT